MENIIDIIFSWLVDQKEFMISFLVILLNIKSIINANLINDRDNSQHLMVGFSFESMAFTLESLLTFYWRLRGNKRVSKLISNILSFTFLLLVAFYIANYYFTK